jgi:16S rRNA (uracil1498-N3)-methyltransferase
MPSVSRRIHVPLVSTGLLTLNDREAHHVRDVLRLRHDDAVEVFDDAGAVGEGKLQLDPTGAHVRVETVRRAPPTALKLTIASAIPKAARADWLVEKLSELGVDAFIPLETARSVVVPEGKNKLDRWARLATEAAKQSHRNGVMRIEPVAPLTRAIESAMSTGQAWHLSTAPGAVPIAGKLFSSAATPRELLLFVGPEGGWTPEEIDRFTRGGVPGVSLGGTILRIETAAIAAAALVAAARDSTIPQPPLESPPG